MNRYAAALAALASLALTLALPAAGCLDDPLDGDATADTEVAPDTPLPDTAAPDTAAPDTLVPDTADEPDSVADAHTDTADAHTDTADVGPPAPPVIAFTVNRIPTAMNGAVPWDDLDGGANPFRLRVNRAFTTLDVLADLRAGGPVDWESLSVSCDVAGEPLALGPFVPAADGASATFAVDAAAGVAADALPDGAAVTCLATADGPGGAAPPSGLTFESAALPASRDPFAEVDDWLVILSRDIFSVTTEPNADGTVQVWSTHEPDGDGSPDLLDALYVLGLATPDNPEATELVRAHLVSAIRARTNRFFGLDAAGAPTPAGVRLRLWFEGDPDAPTPADHADGVSLIALGGDGSPADQAAGTFGRARLDWNNQKADDNSVYGLGVFPTAAARAVLGQQIGVLLLADILPSRGGVAIGSRPEDSAFIGLDTFDGGALDSTTLRRAELYVLAIDLVSLALASILAHEIGHSLGLVPYEPPPLGLFAGVAGPSFLESFAPDAHIDTADLNIMQTGGSVNWALALSSDPAFNPLNWAYLRRQLVVGLP